MFVRSFSRSAHAPNDERARCMQPHYMRRAAAAAAAAGVARAVRTAHAPTSRCRSHLQQAQPMELAHPPFGGATLLGISNVKEEAQHFVDACGCQHLRARSRPRSRIRPHSIYRLSECRDARDC